MSKRTSMILLLAGAVSLAGCGDTFEVEDLNNPGLRELETNPTAAAVVAASQGLMAGGRTGLAGQTGYVAQAGILGRESLTFDNSDPRYIDEMVAGDLDPGNGAFGGSGWAPRYANIRNGNIILNALDLLPPDAFDDEELAAIRGWVKFFQALDYLQVINLRYDNGAVIDVNRGLSEDPGPFESRATVLQHVVDLLDESADDLADAGSTDFPFQLSPGFDDFSTPEDLIPVTWALRARVEAYRGNYPEVLTALTQSFLTSSSDLDLGVYHAFGTGAGDLVNGLFQGPDPAIVAHPSIRDDAQTQSGGALDARVLRWTEILDDPKVDARGVSSDVRLSKYPTMGSPLAIIRNEELILLRAEARWFTGDPGGAMDDINDIRNDSGGLDDAPMPASDAEFVDELLYQRRYSLLMEGAHSWIDHRRFGRLDQLPLDRAADEIPDAFPVPRPECIARSLPVPCGA